jgi:hypothetical protein
MSSTEFGESLLANVRERNDKRAREYEKRAKKDAWKELGVRAAIGLGKSMIEQRQEQFLNHETRLANKLKVSNATDTATRYTTTEANANAFTGGRDMYFQGLAAPQVKGFMESEYATGTYNQTQYDLLEKQLTAKYGKSLDEQHKIGLEKTNAFLETTGGDKGAYLAALKRENPGSASGIISKFIGSKTGIIKTDLHNSTQNMLERADQLKTYQTTYSATGDSAISAFVAKEGLLDDVDLGEKAPTYSEVKTKSGPFGEEVSYLIQTVYDKDGVVSKFQEIYADPTTGEFMFNTAESSRIENNFNILTAQVQTATDKTYFEAGKNALINMDENDLKLVQDVAKDRINNSNKSTGRVGQGMLESVNDNISGKLGAIIYTATKGEGWATSSDAAIIGQQMILNNAQNPGTRVLSGVGFNNPYHTMFAMSDAFKNGKINTITDGFTDIGTKSISGLYNAYRSETTPGRAAIEAKLKETNYFEGKVGGKFKQFHTAMKAVFDDKTLAGTPENLEAMFMKMYMPNPIDSDMNKDTGVMDGAIPAPVSVSGRLKLPANLDNATDTTRRSAASQYKAILSAEKKFSALSEKLAPQTRTDVTPQAMEIINARNASKLAKEKAKLDNRIKVYVNMYGEKASPEMLEDFDDKEKELYFSTGTLPDRHTPAV